MGAEWAQRSDLLFVPSCGLLAVLPLCIMQCIDTNFEGLLAMSRCPFGQKSDFEGLLAMSRCPFWRRSASSSTLAQNMRGLLAAIEGCACSLSRHFFAKEMIKAE